MPAGPEARTAPYPACDSQGLPQGLWRLPQPAILHRISNETLRREWAQNRAVRSVPVDLFSLLPIAWAPARKHFSEPWQHDPLLFLVLTLPVSVTDFADFVRLKEKNLAKSLIGVDARRQRSGVGDFEGHKTLPLRLKRRHVHDDPATGIGRFAHADRQDIARNFEIFDRTRQREAV